MESEINRWVISEFELMGDQGPFTEAKAEEAKEDTERVMARLVARLEVRGVALPQYQTSIVIRRGAMDEAAFNRIEELNDLAARGEISHEQADELLSLEAQLRPDGPEPKPWERDTGGWLAHDVARDLRTTAHAADNAVDDT